MPKTWVRERRRDFYYRKAKEEKFRSRAAYKLFQAVEKYHFIESGNIVVDLGSAPGGWIQAAREVVGAEGFVVGVDLEPIEPFSESNVRTIQGDIRDQRTLQQILDILPRKADAVTSDASPNISGIWEVDHARQIELADRALEIALMTLKTSGNFYTKLFQGDMLSGFVKQARMLFDVVRIVKPKASRSKSSEIFILGAHLKQYEL